MKQNRKKTRAIAGVVAPTPRPTPLGAAVVAASLTFPTGVALLIFDLLLIYSN